MGSLCLGVLLLSILGISGQCLFNTTYPNRLPSSVLPRSYSLNFTLASPNDADGNVRTSYTGAVSVSLSVMNATTCIVLHAASSLQILDARLNQDGTITKPDQILSNSTYEFLILQFSLPISATAKSSVLNISFSGKVNPDSAAGLFICENVYDPSTAPTAEKKRDILKRAPWASKKHHERKPLRRSSMLATEMMYATQFEQTSARMAFPCWDEPALKATFQTTILVPSGQNLTVLNNWPLTSHTTSGSNEIWTFDQSPHVMSSYLVAWTVGRFDYVEGTTDDGVLVRVYTPVGSSKYGEYGLNISIASLQYFRSLWNMSYFEMSKKLDNIAVPGIDEDAMENWGLCTYSPELLFADPDNLTRDLIQLPTQVVSHELAHQWFGDTITMPYWNQIYLNEGFARLWEYVFTDFYYPDWYVFWIPENSIFGPTDFYDFVYNPSMLDDYTGAYPPIIVDEDQTPVSEIFYAKGASVNYMMMKYLGANSWNQALAYHIAQHKWTNPDVNDLMNSFEAVGLHISAQFLTWLMQPSLPMVVVSLDDSTNLLTATQKPISSVTPSSQLWWVNLPIHAVSSSDSTKIYDTTIQFSTPSTTAQLPTGFTWNVFGNNNYTNYYVVNYNQPRQWSAALAQFESPSFSAVDIQQLQRVVFLLTNRF